MRSLSRLPAPSPLPIGVYLVYLVPMMRGLSQALPLIGLSLGLLAGCVVGPEYERPELEDVGGQYDRPGAFTDEARAEYVAWWSSFEDPALSQLVAMAQAENLELAMAQSRVAQARAETKAARSRIWPAINAGSGISRQSMSENGVFGPVVGTFVDRENTVYTGGLDASWELDFFGRVQHATQAAQARRDAFQYAAIDARRIIAAETGWAYLNWRGAEARLRAAEREQVFREALTGLSRARVETGTLSESSLLITLAQLERLRSRIASLRSERDAAVLTLATLTSSTPETVRDRLRAAPDRPPQTTAPLAAGLPSDLLDRRPDLRAAEAQLQAATAELGVRTADLYPRFILVGSLGQESVRLGDLARRASLAWGVGPDISLPIFNAGRLQGLRDVQRERVHESATNYRDQALRAVREVELALVRLTEARHSQDALARTAALAERTNERVEARFETGVAPRDALIESQIAVNTARLLAALSSLDTARQLIALHKALGGGWALGEE